MRGISRSAYSGADGDSSKLDQLRIAAIIKTKGKTKKVQFKIVDIDIAALGSLDYVLGIFTDRNPSKWGQQCYTSTYEDHPLNSGATLKFTDPDTGFQLSAHTPPITVVAFEP